MISIVRLTKQRDFRTMQFLDWFVKEQGEEETNANDLISKMELFGSDPKSLYMLNQELAAQFTLLLLWFFNHYSLYMMEV